MSLETQSIDRAQLSRSCHRRMRSLVEALRRNDQACGRVRTECVATNLHMSVPVRTGLPQSNYHVRWIPTHPLDGFYYPLLSSSLGPTISSIFSNVDPA